MAQAGFLALRSFALLDSPQEKEHHSSKSKMTFTKVSYLEYVSITFPENLFVLEPFPFHQFPDTWTDLFGNPEATIPLADKPLNFDNTFGKFPSFPNYIAHSLKPLLKKTSQAQKQGALGVFNTRIVITKQYETFIPFCKVWLHQPMFQWKW